MADVAHVGGLIAAGVMRNPFDYGFDIVTTTTHKTLRGPRGGIILTKGNVGNPLKAVEVDPENLPTVIDRSVFPGLQGGPHMNTVAAIAVALHEAMQPEFKEYAGQVLKNAKTLAGELMEQKVKLVTNGTDNHMMVVDTVASFGLGGDEVENILDSVGITTNKSMIPDDARPAYHPSGVRIGSPAMTTRGMKEGEMKKVAAWIVQAVQAREDTGKLAEVKQQVKELSLLFPVPGIDAA